MFSSNVNTRKTKKHKGGVTVRTIGSGLQTEQRTIRRQEVQQEQAYHSRGLRTGEPVHDDNGDMLYLDMADMDPFADGMGLSPVDHDSSEDEDYFGIT